MCVDVSNWCSMLNVDLGSGPAVEASLSTGHNGLGQGPRSSSLSRTLDYLAKNVVTSASSEG